MENRDNTDNKVRLVGENDVCRHFDRAPYSLIEEPEVCEWCLYYNEGVCNRKED